MTALDVQLVDELRLARMREVLSAPVRYSRLRRFALSPAHYLSTLLREDDSDSAGRRFGRLVHALVLGGEVIVYDGERRGKAWAEFKAAHPEDERTTIVTAKERDTGRRVADAVLADRAAAPLLVGKHEHEIAWTNQGRACSSRLDVLGADFVTDLKTTACAEPMWFARNAIRMHYHAQLAFYQDAALSLGRIVDRAYIVAVETKAPYPVVTWELTPRALDAGRRLCALWMGSLLVSECSGEWPGYAQSTLPLDVPDFDGEPTTLLIDGEEVAA